MNVFTAIEEVTYFNSINKPFVKAEIDYKKQHECGPVARKLGSKINKRLYSDDYTNTPIIPICNGMKLQTIKPVNIVKRIPLIFQSSGQVPQGDEEQYKFLLSATKEQLHNISPSEYFGCRTDGTYVFDFNRHFIYRIIPQEYIEKYEDPLYIREGVYVDATTAVVMGLSDQYISIWMDTTKYQPINPNQVHLFDINNSEVYQEEHENIINDLEEQVRQQREWINEMQRYKEPEDEPEDEPEPIPEPEDEPEPEPEPEPETEPEPEPEPEPERYVKPPSRGVKQPLVNNPFLERRISIQQSISNEEIENLVKELARKKNISDYDANVISSTLKEVNERNHPYNTFKQLLFARYNGHIPQPVMKGINEIFNKIHKSNQNKIFY